MSIPADILAAQSDGRIPEGTDIAFLAQSRDLGSKIGIYAVFALATLFFAGRLFARCYVKFDLGLDDVLVSISWACLVAFVGLCHVLIDIGSARHYDYIQYVMTLAEVERSEVLDFAAHLVYTTALFAGRLSGLAFYEQRIISHAGKYKLAIRGTAVFLAAAYIPQILLIIFHCKPVTGLWPYDWQPNAEKYTCLAWGVVYSVNSAVSLVSDLALFAIPVVILCSLQTLPYSKRVKLACVIMPGIGVIGISIARLVLVIRGQWEPDESWEYGPMLAVEGAEIGSTLIALCAPALYPLFRAWKRGLTTGMSKDPSGTSDSIPMTRGAKSHGRASQRSKDIFINEHELNDGV